MISADTNLFVYAVDDRDPDKRDTARAVVTALSGAHAVVGLQVVGELQNALRRRLKMPARLAAQTARSVLNRFGCFAYDREAVEVALAQSALGRLSYWDALLVAAADAVGVTALISEDMAPGVTLGAVEIINPFGPDGPSARVRELLEF